MAVDALCVGSHRSSYFERDKTATSMNFTSVSVTLTALTLGVVYAVLALWLLSLTSAIAVPVEVFEFMGAEAGLFWVGLLVCGVPLVCLYGIFVGVIRFFRAKPIDMIAITIPFFSMVLIFERQAFMEGAPSVQIWELAHLIPLVCVAVICCLRAYRRPVAKFASN